MPRASGRSSRSRRGRSCSPRSARSPAGLSMKERVRSNFAVATSTSRRSRAIPGRSGAGRAALCTTSITWKIGLTARSRPVAISSTSISNGQILMGEVLERRPAHPAQQLLERRIAGEVDPQREGVQEEADQALGLQPVPVRHRRSHDEVLLGGVAGEQRAGSGEERHEQGRSVPPRDLLEAAQEVRREEPRPPAAPEARRRGARPVGRQLQHGRRAGQPAPPVGHLPPPAPRPAASSAARGEVGVLDGEGGRRRLPAPGQGAVERVSSPDSTPIDQPSEMTWCRVKRATCSSSARAEQDDAEQRPPGEVERAPRLVSGEAADLGPPRLLRQGAEIDQRPGRAPAPARSTCTARPPRIGEGWSAGPRAGTTIARGPP